MRIRPQLVFPRVRPPHTRRMYVYSYVGVYLCTLVHVCRCELCPYFIVIFFNKILLICYCKKVFACVRVYVCIVYVCTSAVCRVHVCVCVPCVCSRVRFTRGRWWIPTTLRAYFSRRTRERERKIEKRRESGYREIETRTYCLSYPAPTNGTRVTRTEINKLVDKKNFHPFFG